MWGHLFVYAFLLDCYYAFSRKFIFKYATVYWQKGNMELKGNTVVGSYYLGFLKCVYILICMHASELLSIKYAYDGLAFVLHSMFQWSEKRRLEIAGLMSSILRAHLQAYDPVFSISLRYRIRYIPSVAAASSLT